MHDRSEFVFIENAQIDKTALLTAFDVYRLQDRLEFVIIVNAQSTVAFEVYRLHDRSEFVFIENAQIDKTALLTAFDVYRLHLVFFFLYGKVYHVFKNISFYDNF